MRIMETLEEKMERQFMSLCNQADNSIRPADIYTVAIKVAQFSKENMGLFIVNVNPNINNGHNFTEHFLTKTLWDKLESRKRQLPQEDLDLNYLLAMTNKNSPIKIVTK